MLKKIKKQVLADKDVNYGYYGSKTIIPKRWLWWKRLEIINELYSKYSLYIKKGVILDFGAEFAFFSASISKEYKKIYLIELNKKLLTNGVKIHNKFGNKNYFAFINDKSNNLNFTKSIKNKVDLFLFFDVLEHVRGLNSFVIGIKKIASNNSFFLVTLPTENFLYLLLTKFKREKDHCNRYYEVEKILKKNDIQLICKKSLLFLFNIYLFKLEQKNKI